MSHVVMLLTSAIAATIATICKAMHTKYTEQGQFKRQMHRSRGQALMGRRLVKAQSRQGVCLGASKSVVLLCTHHHSHRHRHIRGHRPCSSETRAHTDTSQTSQALPPPLDLLMQQL